MNTHAKVIAAGLMFALHAHASLDAAELIGHWDFAASGPALGTDRSSHGRDAVLQLGPQKRPSHPGALALDGYAEHGEIERSRGMEFPHGATLAAWINPTRLKRNSMVIGVPNPNPAWTTPTFGLFAPEAGRIGFGLWTSPKVVLIAPTPTPIRSWTLITGTYDNHTARLYIDGECVAEKACNKPIPVSDSPLMLGTGTMSNQFYQGLIGEIRLYDGALDADQIRELYAGGEQQYPRTPNASGEQQNHIVVRSKRKPTDPWREYATRTLEQLNAYSPTERPVP